MLRARIFVAALSVVLATLSPAVAGIAPSGDAARISPLIARSPEPRVYHTYGLYLKESIWLIRPINVCWNMPKAEYDRTRAARHAIRAAIENSWGKNAALTFAGWRACGGSISNGFGITSSDVRSHTVALGTELDGNLSGMVLNFDYNNFSPSCKTTLQFCDDVIATHEFGHALGLAHEQNRADNPEIATCPADPGPTQGDVTVGAWDINSVMNYCNPNWNGGGNLSPTDIATIQQMYGAPGGPTSNSFTMSFNHQHAGDCSLDGATIQFNPNGTAVWSASVSTSSRHDVWITNLTLLDAAGHDLQRIPKFDSPVMRESHGPYPWNVNFTFNPSLFGQIKGAHLHGHC
jgi:hypothetical protein